jgi:plastocyanin
MNSVLRKVLSAALVVCLLVSMPMMASATEHIVTIVGISFIPNSIIVNVGDTVKWVNNSSGLFHTSTSGILCSPDGNWNLNLPFPSEASMVMNTPGVFDYFCIPHCAAIMVGVVIVDAPVGVEQETWGAIKALYQIDR